MLMHRCISAGAVHASACKRAPTLTLPNHQVSDSSACALSHSRMAGHVRRPGGRGQWQGMGHQAAWCMDTHACLSELARQLA